VVGPVVSVVSGAGVAPGPGEAEVPMMPMKPVVSVVVVAVAVKGTCSSTGGGGGPNGQWWKRCQLSREQPWEQQERNSPKRSRNETEENAGAGNAAQKTLFDARHHSRYEIRRMP
jgi:hypothetical protein